MTDAELQRLWSEGRTLAEIAQRADATVNTIVGRVRRARKRDGVKLWPLRSIIVTRKTAPAKRLKPGEPTLPPLGSCNAP